MCLLCRYMPFSKEITEYENQINLSKSEAALITDRVAAAKSQLSAAKESLENLTRSVAGKSEDLKAVLSKLKETKNKQPEFERAAKEAAEREVKITEEVRVLRQRTEEGKASQSASKSRNALITALMDAKKSKKLPGTVYSNLCIYLFH